MNGGQIEPGADRMPAFAFMIKVKDSMTAGWTGTFDRLDAYL